MPITARVDENVADPGALESVLAQRAGAKNVSCEDASGVYDRLGF